MSIFCTAPFVGIVVDPMLNIQMCCSDSSRHFKTNLRDIDSLRDFFYNSSQYQKLRDDVGKYSLSKYKPCSDCSIIEQGFRAEINNFNKFFPNPHPIKLRYLEVTTSNVCTQTCVMCSPPYSTSLIKIHKWGNAMSMNDNDLKKVYEVLPDIEVLSVKGGEPFADQKNLKILEELYRVNPDIGNIIIVSNGSHISDSFQQMLLKFKNITLSISMDGVDKVYEWVRGSSYRKTVDSLNSFYDNTGITYTIQNAVTVYTLPTLATDCQQYYKDFKGLRYVESSNIVNSPAFLSPAMYDNNALFLMTGRVSISNAVRLCKHGIQGILNISNHSPDKLQKYYSEFKMHTNFYNKIRGFNILDHVPEAKELYESLNG